MANPTAEGLQVMYIILTVYKYNINDGFVIPLLDEHMPKTSSIDSYSNTEYTRQDQSVIHEVYTKRSRSRGYQCLVLLRLNSNVVPLSMGPDEEAQARLTFER